MGKQLIPVLVVSVTLSTGIGFAMGSTANPEPADAASTADVVRQLRTVNTNLRAINTKLGTEQESQGSVRGLLTIICDFTASIDCSPSN